MSSAPSLGEARDPQSPRVSPATEDQTTKRRKLRKGTCSCWECKRRKVKCIFSTEDAIQCVNCRRRGSKCVSQDLPEGHEVPTPQSLDNRLDKVESLVNALNQRAVNESKDPRSGSPVLPSRVSILAGVDSSKISSIDNPTLENDKTQYCRVDAQNSPSSHHSSICIARARPYQSISRNLLAAFPTEKDIKICFEAAQDMTVFPYLINFKSSRVIAQEGSRPETYTHGASINTHPVLLAKQMMMISLLLLDSDCKETGLSVKSCLIVPQITTAVLNLVIKEESFYGSIEYLQCIVMHAVYLMSVNNLRHAWLAYRRAIAVAQMMGLHQTSKRFVKTLDPSSQELDFQYIWHRIIMKERLLCLLLGFPHTITGTNKTTEASLANDGPISSLDRAHATIAASILEINQDGGPFSLYAEDKIQHINSELLRVAGTMPTKFWMPPNFHGIRKRSSEEFWEGWRVTSHIVHYNLINQLHLPKLLRFSAECHDESSKLACMNATREILTRYNAFRSCKVEPGCTMCDLFALMAGMTLMLGHLDTHLHRRQSTHFLAHQRLSDRTMMEELLETLNSLFRINEDVISKSSIGILQCLLRVEEDAADGAIYTVHSLGGSDDELQELAETDKLVLWICIPYFGQVKITREDGGPREQADVPSLGLRQDESRLQNPATAEADVGEVGTLELGGNSMSNLLSTSQHFPTPESLTRDQYRDSNSLVLPSLLHQYWDPEALVDIDDWAFQGVDMSFFDAVMRAP